MEMKKNERPSLKSSFISQEVLENIEDEAIDAYNTFLAISSKESQVRKKKETWKYKYFDCFC